ncbi:CCA tRNA nucleotidyltransferase [Wolbachia endosymbiont of Howardula sp.]|uniref:CCA tRNA nucleotidyltransferase n=1 Tax=Wolbachia endosymbiont of Howardula sp. TaxID=2916816 RepID=UPI00217CD015|nr:CCA tRNA nucleotidyltransferase [Wolbachia endosymbiont of Howardula sp.]UWI83378.1 CCA tRNA nucleotidyltransferase [Wolbachia endosymbiont of Howardula sp.]
MQCIRESSHLIFSAIEEYGGIARLVGGCVRDALLGCVNHDIDLATNLLPEYTVEALKKYNIKTILTGLHHGTITAILDKQSFEITTLRYDTQCYGRYAKVKFTDNWQADASRRDFTFNALYADMSGKIYDYFDGIQDLKNRKLHFIGRPEDRIQEDYLRILRAFRFHAKLCLGKLSHDILSTCKKYSHHIDYLSGERIREEIFQLLRCVNPAPTLKLMQESEILQKIIPMEVQCDILLSKRLVNTDVLVKLALILRTAKKHRLDLGEHVSKLLRLSNKEKKKLLFLLSNNFIRGISEREQERYISLFSKALYCDLALIYSIESGEDVEQFISFANTFTIPKFPLSGSDLISIGYDPGENLGRTLNYLRNCWENSAYTLTKDELMQNVTGISIIRND